MGSHSDLSWYWFVYLNFIKGIFHMNKQLFIMSGLTAVLVASAAFADTQGMNNDASQQVLPPAQQSTQASASNTTTQTTTGMPTTGHAATTTTGTTTTGTDTTTNTTTTTPTTNTMSGTGNIQH
jgi:hypothetical protein